MNSALKWPVGTQIPRVAKASAPGLPIPPVSNPTLWVRSDQGLFTDAGKTTKAVSTNDAIAVWADLSGNGNDLTQGTAGSRPTLQLSVVNGQSVVRFDGVNDFLENTGFTQSFPGTLFLVAKTRNNDTSGMFCGDPTTNLRYVSVSIFNNRITTGNGGGNANLDSTAVNTEFTVIQRIFDSTAGEIRAKSASADVSIAVTAGTNAPVSIKINDGILEADLAEILFYASALSPGNLTTVRTYMGARYGLF